MASSQNPTSPLADYEDDDDTRDHERGGLRDDTGLQNHPDSPDMMDVEGGESTQFSDYTFSVDENKERSNKTEDSLSTKARQFIAKNKNRSIDSANECLGGSAAKITNAAEDPPPSPAPTSNVSQSKEKICSEPIDFPPQFFTIRAARLWAANTTALGDSLGTRRGGGRCFQARLRVQGRR
jgi:hypothetical protein